YIGSLSFLKTVLRVVEKLRSSCCCCFSRIYPSLCPSSACLTSPHRSEWACLTKAASIRIAAFPFHLSPYHLSSPHRNGPLKGLLPAPLSPPHPFSASHPSPVSFLAPISLPQCLLPIPSLPVTVCDPVMGDDGRLYIRPELVPIYRHQVPPPLAVSVFCEVVPVATLITPNQFEAEQLTGLSIRTQADAITACDMLHAAGPRKQRSQLVMAEGIGFAWARPSLKPAPSLSTAFNHSVQVVITSMEVDGRLLVVGSDASSPAGEEVSEVRRHEGICLVVEVCFESPGVQPLNHICLA
ncbi:unnamed protein product, partial [Closterium sp. NIES-65]